MSSTTSSLTGTDGGAGAPARPARPLRALDRLSLRSLLLGGLALVLAFCVLVVTLLEVHRARTYRLVGDLIAVDNVISDLCLKSTSEMIDARRLEKDFLLYDKEFGFDEAKSRYLTRLRAGLVEIGENMARIRELAGDGEAERLTRRIDEALVAYGAGIEALADRHAERGYVDRGAYGAMRAEAHGIEALVRGTRSDALLARYLSVRRFEKDFVERELDADAAKVRAGLDGLLAAAASSALPAPARERLAESAGRYLGLFEDYVRTTEEIREIKHTYLRSVQRIDPLLEELYVGSLARVAAKQRELTEAMRKVRFPVLAAGGLVFLGIALLSLVVVLRVSRGVVESTSFAERIAAGDLRGRLAPGGGREFRALTNALNSMTDSLLRAELRRRSDEDALRQSEERYRAFVETSADWIWAIDLEGRHTYSNERVRDILGIGPRELLEGRLADLVHPEDLPRATEAIAAAIAAGKGWQGLVLRWRHRDGTYRALESSAVPVRDAAGALVGFRGVDRDVTERLRMEEELVKAQKLEAVGTLAGGIAHDFNNLLQGLFGYLSLAKLSLGRPDRALELLEQAERALGLSVNLTTQLLTFSRGGKPVRRRIELRELLEDSVRFALSGSRSDYRISLPRDLAAIDADAGQLGQVLQNLVLNAAEAMPDGGTVEVAAANARLDPGANALVPEGGEFVRITVRDRGVGISPQHLSRIFDPYFTTKERGTGLGLATSYSIVRAHGGFIDVTPRPGGGTDFSVYLPASTAAEDRERPTASGRPVRAGTVLVMDDEELVRDVAVGMIEQLGHAVTAVANGEEALEAYRREREEGRPFDVVILDLTVKRGMGGAEALRSLRALDPAVRAIVSSGYADAPVVADFRAHGFSARLAKPYRLEELRELLSSLLGAAPAAAERESAREG